MKLYQHILTEQPFLITEGKVKTYDINPPTPNPKFEEIIRKGKGALITLTILTPIPTTIVAYLTYQFDITAFQCSIKCRKEKEKDLCKARCKYKASKKVIHYLQQEIKEIPKIKNKKERKKVEKQLYKMLITWRQKMTEYSIQLKTLEKHSKTWTRGKGWKYKDDFKKSS